MITVDCIQGTPEWFAAKCGIPSASNFDKIITTKGEPSKSATKYMYQLAAERVTGRSEESYTNVAMERGKETEAEARNLYEMLHDVKIEQVGFCYPDEARTCGASPDGLIGKDGLIEIKCPMAFASVGYILEGVLPTDYIQQVQGQLYVTGRKWLDFLSYYPGLRPMIVRVQRDDKFIALLQQVLNNFCAELEKITEKIR